jgi:uncharacterized membrane protein YccC
MPAVDFEEALFSLKCLAAGILAYWAAARIGLSHPYWAVTTSYIVAQPLSGAVFSKAVFRLVGTVLGAAASVALVPMFVNEPLVLSFALATWLALCIYLARIDRTARAYTFLLAGFTASIIGFQSVTTPGAIFDTAVLRVQEIGIGILASALVHAAVLPRTVSAQLQRRVEAMVHDAEARCLIAVRGAAKPESRMRDAHLTKDIDELEQLSIHLPFDTASVAPAGRIVRALIDRLALIFPLAMAVEERLQELQGRPGRAPPELCGVLERTGTWLELGSHAPEADRNAEALIAEARALEPMAAGAGLWREMLILSLLSRLSELIATVQLCRRLSGRIQRPTWRDGLDELLAGGRSRSLHRDHGLALRWAAGTAAVIMLGSLFWIETRWADGAQAVFISGVACAIFSGAARPAPEALRFLGGFAWGLAVSLFYAFVVFPRVTDGVALAAVVAPAFLLLGSLLARPRIARFAQGALIALPNTVGLNLTYNPDFAAFVNPLLAQLVGVAFVTTILTLLRTTDMEAAVARVRRACFRDMARRLTGRDTAAGPWLDRMLDRINLLRAWTYRQDGGGARVMLDGLRNMRIGFTGGELHALEAGASPEDRRETEALLSAIGEHFAKLDPRRPAPPPASLLGAVDRKVTAFAGEENATRRRDGLVILAGLRRNLFPAEPGYGEAAA